ncbi:MAG: hypothetical protein ACLS6O_00555 [Bifidobacterium sp.]
MRGPLVYCANRSITPVIVELSSGRWRHRCGCRCGFRPTCCGVDTLICRQCEHADEDDAPLYVDAERVRANPTLRLVPYYSWANREIGEMRVFQRR